MRVSFKKRNTKRYFVFAIVAMSIFATTGLAVNTAYRQGNGNVDRAVSSGMQTNLDTFDLKKNTLDTSLSAVAPKTTNAMDSTLENQYAFLTPKIEFLNANDQSIDYASLGEPTNASSTFKMKVTNPSNSQTLHIKEVTVSDINSSDLSSISKGSGWDNGVNIGYTSLDNSNKLGLNIGTKSGTNSYTSDINEIKKITISYYYDDILDADKTTQYVFTQNEYIAVVGRVKPADASYDTGKIQYKNSTYTELNLRIKDLGNSSNDVYIGSSSAAAGTDKMSPISVENNAGTLYYVTNIYANNAKRFEEIGTYIDAAYNASQSRYQTIDNKGLIWEIQLNSEGVYSNKERVSIENEFYININGNGDVAGTTRSLTSEDVLYSKYNSDYGYRIQGTSGTIYTATNQDVTVWTDMNAVRRKSDQNGTGICSDRDCTARLFLTGKIPEVPAGQDHAEIVIKMDLVYKTNGGLVSATTGGTLAILINVYPYGNEYSNLSSEIKNETQSLPVSDYLSENSLTNFETASQEAKKAFVDAVLTKNYSIINTKYTNLKSQYNSLTNTSNLYSAKNLIQQKNTQKTSDYSSETKQEKTAFRTYDKYTNYALPYDTTMAYASSVSEQGKYTDQITGSISSNLQAEYNYWKIDLTSLNEQISRGQKIINQEIDLIEGCTGSDCSIYSLEARNELQTKIAAVNAQITAMSANTDAPQEQEVIDDMASALKSIIDNLDKKIVFTFKDADGGTFKTFYAAPGETVALSTIGTPNKGQTLQEVFTFDKWNDGTSKYESTGSITATTNLTFTPEYSSVARPYSFKFYNEGAHLSDVTISYGETGVLEKIAAATGTPTKSSNVRYDYSFSGWDYVFTDPFKPTQVPNETINAQFSTITRNYHVIFKNGDGDQIGDISSITYDSLQTLTNDYVVTNVLGGITPTKTRTLKNYFMFNGTWTPDLTEGATPSSYEIIYTANFTTNVNSYNVYFYNYDGILLDTVLAKYEEIPAYSGSTPTKTSDAQYDYTFDAWKNKKDNSDLGKLICTDVYANYDTDCYAEYVATYTNQLREYDIIFKNWDGTVLAEYSGENQIPYGTVPTEPENVYRPSTAQFKYAFKGWKDASTNKTTDVIAVDGPKTYIADYSSSIRSYTIQFKNNGTVFEVQSLDYGETPTAPLDTPQKESTAQYDYTFEKWDPEIEDVTGPQTYTAIYTETLRKYTVKFINYDNTELQSSSVEYGATPAYEGTTPERASDNEHNYTFKGWDKTISAVTGEATYTATYNEEYIYYTITFEDWDGSVITTDSAYAWNEHIIKPETEPFREADAQYTYSFSGWSPEVSRVKGNTTFTAQYNSTVNKYPVIFEDEDGTELDRQEIEFGSTAEYKGATPAKSADNTYTYTFKEWSPEIAAVNCSDAADCPQTYTATYTGTYIDYTIRFEDYDGTEIETKTLHWNDEVTAPTDPTREADNTYTYTFAGWDSEIVNVDGNKTYKATYNETFIDYIIIFYDEDGSTILSQKNDYHYGDTVITPENPTKKADNTYTYAFSGWDSEVVNVDRNKTYKAIYQATFIEYTAKFILPKDEEDDVVYFEKTYHYNDAIVLPVNPTKEATVYRTYEFERWAPEVPEKVTGNSIHYALFTGTLIDYTVRFEDYDGTEIKTLTLNYGDEVTAPTDPTREADKENTYAFAGWDSEVVNVDGSKTYKATYTATPIDYTIKFIDWNDEVLSSKVYNYGDTVEEPANPTRETTPAFEYTFKGWDKKVEAATGDTTYKAIYEGKAYDIEYEWLENQTFTIGEDGKAVLHIEIAKKFFNHKITVDGEEIEEGKDYIISDGSTIVTLQKSYLDTLGTGIHKINVYYDENIALETNFTIEEPVSDIPDTDGVDEPDTGAQTKISDYVKIASIAPVLGATAIIFYIAKKKKQTKR